MRYLTFALGKGRLAKKTLELFEKIGITCEEMKDKDSRKLIFVNEELKLRFFLAKGPDVPTYVEYGAADIGIVGEDTILEERYAWKKATASESWIRKMPDVRLRTTVCGRTSETSGADPRGNQVSTYCKRLFL